MAGASAQHQSDGELLSRAEIVEIAASAQHGNRPDL